MQNIKNQTNKKQNIKPNLVFKVTFSIEIIIQELNRYKHKQIKFSLLMQTKNKFVESMNIHFFTCIVVQGFLQYVDFFSSNSSNRKFHCGR